MRGRAPRRRRVAFPAALSGALCALSILAAPGLAQDEPPPELQQPEIQEIGLLFTQTAERGKLSHREGKGSDRFALVLRHPASQTVWFQDHPGRQNGQIPTGGFVDEWEGFGFADDPPNAALTLLDAPHHGDTVILTLGIPRYKPKREKLVYPVRIEEEAVGGLSHFESQRDDEVSTRFTDASLFIDDASAPVVNGCVIQAYALCPNANLAGADLSGADLTAAHLTGADLSNANLSNAILTATVLTGANLDGADLTGADGMATNLSNANLSNANLSNATLTSIILNYANLTGANLTRAALRGANLLNANLTGATLTGANLSSSYGANANLTGADLSFASLFGSILINADLTNADLVFANLANANLANANLSGANLARVNYCNTTIPDGGNSGGSDCDWGGLAQPRSLSARARFALPRGHTCA